MLALWRRRFTSDVECDRSHDEIVHYALCELVYSFLFWVINCFTTILDLKAEIPAALLPRHCSGTMSQVTPQGHHRQGSNREPKVSSSMPLPTWTRQVDPESESDFPAARRGGQKKWR